MIDKPMSFERLIELERRDAERDLKREIEIREAVSAALENAAIQIEKLVGGRNYEQAYRRAAQHIRSLKP